MQAVEENSKPSESATQPIPDPLHIWTGLADANAANAWVEHHLAASRACIAELLAVTGPRTVDNTLVPYDRACWHLRMAGSQSGVMFMVHPLADVRDAAQQLSQVIGAESVALSLNRDVYQALAALNESVTAAPTSTDPATLYYLDRALLGYRLSGVDKDEPTRDRIRTLADTMTQLSMTFSRAVQDDVRKIPVDNPDDLLGLPDDYLARHGVHHAEATDDGPYLTADAPVALTTDPPEMAPVMTYAINPQLRRRMYLAYNDRAYPANKQVLLDLLAAREEMASLLGFRSWADLATVDQMMGSAANMRTFLNEVEAAALETAQARVRRARSLRPRARSQRPPTHSLRRPLLGRAVPPRPLRLRLAIRSPLLPVRASRSRHPHHRRQTLRRPLRTPIPPLPFGPQASKPSPSSMTTSGPSTLDPEPSPLGRIYLDMHPREGKSKWFSECSLVSGVLNHQLPEASLVCNFPQPKKDNQHPENDDAGLMQYSDVVTCFHEFGHLMHEVLGGRQRWAGQSGISTEGDFVEVPSQMLEEFFEDPELVRTFARHYQTGEPIPHDVFARMVRASAHGRALATLTQVMYATYSMETHDKPVADLDLDALLRVGYDRFSRYEFVDGNRMYSAFTHLVGYTSNYYTYLYDKVMALEFFEQFDPSNLIEGPTALRYRREVLEPGGSKPARDLVHAFLGREVSMSALKQWIAREFESK